MRKKFCTWNFCLLFTKEQLSIKFLSPSSYKRTSQKLRIKSTVLSSMPKSSWNKLQCSWITDLNTKQWRDLLNIASSIKTSSKWFNRMMETNIKKKSCWKKKMTFLLIIFCLLLWCKMISTANWVLLFLILNLSVISLGVISVDALGYRTRFPNLISATPLEIIVFFWSKWW